MEFFLHGITAMNYPPQHCLSTTSLWKNTECSVSNAHPCWAPYTLVQAHNPIAAKLHYFEHCYRQRFVSVPLELMLVHATQFCERDLVVSNRHILYCIVNRMFIGPYIIVIVEELKTNLMSLVIFISLIICSTCFEH